MRLSFLLALLLLATGLYLFSVDLERDKLRDQKINAIQEELNTLRLRASDPSRILVYDATRVGDAKSIKY